MLGLLLAIAFVLPADAPSIVVKAPATVRPGEVFYLDASESVSDEPIEWTLNNKPSLFKTFDDGPRKGVLSAAVGLTPGTTMRFVAVASGVPAGTTKSKFAVFVLDVQVLGETPPPIPTPNPPPTPTPTPDPKPPVPPTPQVDPVVTDKLRVVFLYESSNPGSLTQVSAMNAPAVRLYLASRCTTDADGRPAFRFLDKDADTKFMSDSWKKAVATAKADPMPIPKFAVFAGDTLLKVYPVKDEDATLDNLKLHGGR